MIYSRFWHKFLYDLDLVPVSEPYAKRTAQGLILGPDGEKMSKSKGNVIDPNDVVDEYGADVLRTYTLFMGDYGSAAPWSQDSVRGCKRFLERFAALDEMVGSGSDAVLRSVHKTIKKVTNDIDSMKFNTAIAAMMALLNDIYAAGSIDKESLLALTRILCPFAPHICEEMWEKLGMKGFCSTAAWPAFDEALTVDNEKEIAVQVCGKLKGTVVIPAGAEEDAVWEIITGNEAVMAALDGKQIVKKIYIKDKIFNIVAK
jgi:leucyl-tRNA synthetase